MNGTKGDMGIKGDKGGEGPIGPTVCCLVCNNQRLRVFVMQRRVTREVWEMMASLVSMELTAGLVYLECRYIAI